MQTYYHPTEFVTTEFWDGVNFRYGADPERSAWKLPKRRTAESSEQAYRLFLEFVDYARSNPAVHIVTARDLRQVMEPLAVAAPNASARKLVDSIDVQDGYSPASCMLALLGVSPRYVDGPTQAGVSTWTADSIPRWMMDRAKRDAAGFIEREGRLPEVAWFGSHTLSLADFAATIAGDDGSPQVRVRRGRLDVERYIATDAARSYDWVIHPKGFAPGKLLDMARLQAWTLQPARLR